MSDEIMINIRGVEVPISNLIKDVEAAKRKGYSGRFAFMPETVEGLLEAIQLINMERNQLKLRVHQIETEIAKWRGNADLSKM